MFLAHLTVSSIYKVKVIKTLPPFENQFDLLQPKHKVSKVEKKSNGVSTVRGASQDLCSEAVSSGGPLLCSQAAH